MFIYLSDGCLAEPTTSFLTTQTTSDRHVSEATQVVAQVADPDLRSALSKRTFLF